MSATQLTLLWLESPWKKYANVHRIDSALQKKIAEQISQWWEILNCILDVVFFLAEYNLHFHASSSKIGDSDNGLFLGALELLGKHNRILALHLQSWKIHQDKNFCKDLKMNS